MIHRHILSSLHAYLAHYLDPANEAAALDLVDGTSVNGAQLNKILARVRGKINLRTYAQAGNATPPLIVAQLQNRRAVHRPLGHTFNGGASSISKQDAQVEVLCTNNEECEILSAITAASLEAARADFVANGYLFYEVEGLDEPTPQELLASEELGIYSRKISVSAMVQESFAPVIPPSSLGNLSLGLAPDGRVTAKTSV